MTTPEEIVQRQESKRSKHQASANCLHWWWGHYIALFHKKVPLFGHIIFKLLDPRGTWKTYHAKIPVFVTSSHCPLTFNTSPEWAVGSRIIVWHNPHFSSPKRGSKAMGTRATFFSMTQLVIEPTTYQSQTDTLLLNHCVGLRVVYYSDYTTGLV